MDKNEFQIATEYGFSTVFDQRDTQAEIFGCAGLDLVEDVVKGRNALLFAYGVRYIALPQS